MDKSSPDRLRRSFLRSTALAAPAALGGLAGCNSIRESETPTRTATQQYPGRESLPDPLAVDSSNSVVFLNDQSTDNYMGELALGMADSGTIDLEGFLLGYPREVWKAEDQYDQHRKEYVTNHNVMHEKAVESGMSNLPPPEFGVFDQHDKPESGSIEDTKPIGSTGTDRIIEAARMATPEDPLVVTVGGDLCTVADAYLIDPGIADSLVVYWHEQVEDINEQDGYNIQNSGWSAYIVLKRLSVVLDHDSGGLSITQEEVADQIPSPLDRYMMSKEHWNWGNPLQSTDWSARGEHEISDEKPLLLAVFPDIRLSNRRMAVSGVQRADWDYTPKSVLPAVTSGQDDSELVQITNIRASNQTFWNGWN